MPSLTKQVNIKLMQCPQVSKILAKILLWCILAHTRDLWQRHGILNHLD